MSGSNGAASDYYPPDASFGPARLASTLELGPLPTAVPCARWHAKLILKEWNLVDVADEAELIISELMDERAQSREAASRHPAHKTAFAGQP